MLLIKVWKFRNVCFMADADNEPELKPRIGESIAEAASKVVADIVERHEQGKDSELALQFEIKLV